jgi:hypothetical protein
MKFLKVISILILLPFGSWSTPLKTKIALGIHYTKTNVSCFGQTNGRIEIAVFGGKMPYVIQWQNGETSSVIENLKSGTYKVKVQDHSGTITEESITIESSSPLTITYNSKNEYVVDALNASMNVELSGGTPWENNNSPFYFIRLNGKANFLDPHSLDDETYKMTIEDAMGCFMTIPVKIDFEEANSSPFQLKKNNDSQLGIIKMTLYKPAQVSLMAAQ